MPVLNAIDLIDDPDPYIGAEVVVGGFVAQLAPVVALADHRLPSPTPAIRLVYLRLPQPKLKLSQPVVARGRLEWRWIDGAFHLHIIGANIEKRGFRLFKWENDHA